MILPNVTSPNKVLNSCFTKILYIIRSIEDIDIVACLVHLGVAIKLAADIHEMEGPDLVERLRRIDNMLVECMESDGLDQENNVVKVFRNRKPVNNSFILNERVSAAKTLIEGPLFCCIENEILSIMGTRQVYIQIF